MDIQKFEARDMQNSVKGVCVCVCVCACVCHLELSEVLELFGLLGVEGQVVVSVVVR